MSDEPQLAPDEDPDLAHLSDEEREALADPNNAANPVAVRAKRKKAKLAQKRADARAARIRNVAAEILKFEEGQEFIAWLLFDVAGVMRQDITVSMDKDRALFFGGARSVGLALQAVLVAGDAERFAHMLTKYLKEKNDV